MSCPHCHGTGKASMLERALRDGYVFRVVTCLGCLGTGQLTPPTAAH